MTKEGSLLYLRSHLRKVDRLLHDLERQVQEGELAARVHAAGELPRLRGRRASVAAKIARIEADSDSLWISLKDEVLIDLDALTANVEHLIHHD